MPTSKQNWSKRIIQTLLAVFFFVNVNAQTESLLPEFDINTGLPSNSIRCLKLDPSKRLWIATDNGLSIVNSNEAAHKRIVDAMNQKSIWSLAFLDSLVFVGTRYNGLFVFNHFTGNLLKAYPTSTINQIRKIKVFDNSRVFILTNEGAYTWEKFSLLKMKMDNGKITGFLLDVFQWDNKIWGFTNLSRQMVLVNKSRFVESQLIEQQYNECYFSSLNKNNTLYLGRDGNKNTISVICKNKPIQRINMPPIFGNTFVVFEMAYYRGKFILAFGDTRTNETGSVCILDSNFNVNKVKVTDYVSCLEVDSINNTLYYGTLNKGVYMQRGLTSCQMFNKEVGSGIIANSKYIFSYNSTSFQRIDASSNAMPFKNNIDGGITSLSIEGDTIVSVTTKNVTVYTASVLKPVRTYKYENSNGNVLYSGRVNNTVFTFENYGYVHRYDLDKPYEIPKRYAVFLPQPLKVGNNFFCLNKEKGFSIIERDKAYQLKCSDSSIAFANDYTVIDNALYTLSNKELKMFLIDHKSNELIFKKSINITDLTKGFVPRWILSCKGNLYLLNDNGILMVNPLTITPSHYFYFGNYHQINKPIIIGDSLLLVSNSYLTRFPFSDFEKEIQQSGNLDWNIAIPESVNENLGFQVTINASNYLLQSRSLKQLEVWQNGKLVKTFYTITSMFPFTDGLKYGDFEFRITVGNMVKSQMLSITLPLNRNPYFFGAVLFFILVIVAILFQTILDKRKTKKQLLKNRLEILKQNLNPHFVYNSMNLISSLILEGKNDEAVQVVADFSSLQRTYLETNNKPSISLKEELDFLDAYLALQQKRFQHDNQFTYTINIEKRVNVNEIALPPLILQPIAENAIKYGVVGSTATNKTITIDIKGNSNSPTIISIKDNGNYTGQDGGIGIGQKLVKERIEIFAKTNNKKIDVSFIKEAQHITTGYKVEIRLN